MKYSAHKCIGLKLDVCRLTLKRVKFLADDILKYFFLRFSDTTSFASSCKLSPGETICMNVRAYFLGHIRKKYQFVVC